MFNTIYIGWSHGDGGALSDGVIVLQEGGQGEAAGRVG